MTLRAALPLCPTDDSRAPPIRFRIVTAFGDMVIETYPDLAPHSAGAFARQVEAGAYRSAAFTRIVRRDNDRGSPPIEVIQAWQRTAGDDDPPLIHEPTDRTGLIHSDGTLSLPRHDGGTGSARTFFICIGLQPALDANGGRTTDGLGFAAFGRVVDGMAIARAIHRIGTTEEADDDYLRGQLADAPVIIHDIYPEEEGAGGARSFLADAVGGQPSGDMR